MKYTAEDITVIKTFMGKPLMEDLLGESPLTQREKEAINKVCDIKEPHKMLPMQLAYNIYAKLVELGEYENK